MSPISRVTLQEEKQNFIINLLKQQNSTLLKAKQEKEKQLASIKVFLFMVIHDLKHPTEAIRQEIQVVKDLAERRNKQERRFKDGYYKTPRRITRLISSISN